VTYEAYFTKRLLEALTLAEEAANPHERSIHARTSRYYRDLLQASEKRRSLRHAVKIAAVLHHIAARPTPAIVTDLSTSGFRFTLRQQVIVGTLVGLKLDGLAPIEGYVVWQKGDQVGCKFLVELHPALLEAALAVGPHVE
jgi:hypothetical protein